MRHVLLALATYADRHELRQDYPELTDEDIKQALQFSAANLNDEAFELREAS